MTDPLQTRHNFPFGNADHNGSSGYAFDKSRPEQRMALCEAMIDVCAALFDVSSRDLRSPKRCDQGVARVRQIAMYVCHTSLSISLTEVGRGFARDRTTVSHAVQAVELMRDDVDFDHVVEQVERIANAAFIDIDRPRHA